MNNEGNNIFFDPMTGQPINNVNTNSTSVNSSPVTGQQMNNINQVNPAPIANQGMNNVNYVNQNSMNGQNIINSTPVNDQVFINNGAAFENPLNQNNYTQQGMPGFSNINNIDYTRNVKSKKSLFIILTLVVVALGVGAFFLFGKKNIYNGVNLDYLFDPNKPIVIKENDKYGYITSNGKSMIKPQYLSAGEFYGNYAVVSVENPNSDADYDYLYQVIDKKGKVKVTSESYSGPKYYPNADIWIIDGVLYNNNLKKLSDDAVIVEYAGNGYIKWKNDLTNSAGIMNAKGKVTYTYKFLPGENYISIEASENNELFDDDYCRINIENKKYAIVNCENGKVVHELTKNYISSYGNNIFTISNHDTFMNLYKVYIQDDKVLYKTTSESGNLEYNELGYIKIYDEFNGSFKTRYLDIKTKKIIDDIPTESNDDLTYELIESVYGYKPFDSSELYGVKKGDKIVLDAKYEGIAFVNPYLFNYMKNKKGQELLWTLRDDKATLMDLKKQKTIALFDTDSVYDYEDSTFVEAIIYDDDDSYMVYNVLTGKSKKFSEDDEYEIYSNYITLEKNDNIIYYNTNFDQIYVGKN